MPVKICRQISQTDKPENIIDRVGSDEMYSEDSDTQLNLNFILVMLKMWDNKKNPTQIWHPPKFGTRGDLNPPRTVRHWYKCSCDPHKFSNLMTLISSVATHSLYFWYDRWCIYNLFISTYSTFATIINGVKNFVSLKNINKKLFFCREVCRIGNFFFM